VAALTVIFRSLGGTRIADIRCGGEQMETRGTMGAASRINGLGA
jgi:hypothetical protein